MKNITTNKLQSDLSKVIKEVEGGEVYEVARYSKPVAFLISKEKYEELIEKSNC
jgi:prevent-host-death family protein